MKPWRLRSSFVAVCGACTIVSVNAAVKDAGAAARQTPGARSGGGPSPGSVLWMDQCAGCHGTSVTAGRPRNPFDDGWLTRADDTRMTDAVKYGLPDPGTQDLR